MNTSNKESSRTWASVALFDWDGTAIPGFTIAAWSKYLEGLGLLSRNVLDAINGLMRAYQRHEVAHAELAHKTSQLFAVGVSGVTESVLSSAAARFVGAGDHPPFEYAQRLFTLFRQNKILSIVISGSPAQLLEEYARVYGVGSFYGLRLETTKNGVYSGNVVENPALFEVKSRIVREVTRTHKVLVAFGDADADIPLLEAAKVGIVISAEGHSTLTKDREKYPVFKPNDTTQIVETVKRFLTR